MSTSGDYNFKNATVAMLFDTAYERVGVLPELITAQKIRAAILASNLIFSEWMNPSLNLWLVKREIQSLNKYQSVYDLPAEAIDVLEMAIRQSNRMLGGSAFSQPETGGEASNAFDGNPSTACVQNAPNGYIGYQFSVPSLVQMVGVQSNIDTNYTLIFEYSLDGTNWTSEFIATQSIYPKGKTIWFEMPKPYRCSYFRIAETGGATLNVQELYFERINVDMPISPISRQDYMNLPNKHSVGRPSCYYVNRVIKPNFSLWLVPSGQYKTVIYTYKRYIQDVGLLTDILDIPQRFYEALVAGLAYKLACNDQSITPDRVAVLKSEYDKSIDLARMEDSEKYIPVTMSFDVSQWANKE